MKRFFITTVLIIAAGTITNLSAQNANRYCSTIDNHDNGDGYSMPQGHKFPYNQEPTRTLDDYYNNNRQSNGKSNQGSSAHSGSSHNARSSNNNQSNHHNNSHTGTSNRSSRYSTHR